MNPSPNPHQVFGYYKASEGSKASGGGGQGSGGRGQVSVVCSLRPNFPTLQPCMYYLRPNFPSTT